MSTQIQQQQVQGLVAAVSGVTSNSGNLIITGATLLTDIAATGFSLDTDIDTVSGLLMTTGTALSGSIVNNTNNLATTGNTLSIDISGVASNLVTSGANLSGSIGSTGATLAASLVATGDALSGNLIATGATLTGNLSATGATLAGNLAATGATLTGNLAATGTGLADRLGENSQVASNLGLATTSSSQLYGEVSAIPAATCSTRILQWVGDVPAGTTSGLYLGGVLGKTAEMPSNSQWFVKMYGNAKSIEDRDFRNLGHIGISALETGFIIDHETNGPTTNLSGINGNSGVIGSGIHYEFQVGKSGTTPVSLMISGNNSYTGMVRFHATAYVSQMLH